MMNRGKDPGYQKKVVFGGGLEAARAQQGGGPVKKPAPAPATAPAPPKVAPKPQHTYVPPPLECEVVELDLPGPTYHNYQPPALVQEKPINLVLNEEAIQKEEERMNKSIGRFTAPKSALTPGVQQPPPTYYNLSGQTSSHTGHQPSYNAPSQQYNAPSQQYNAPSQQYNAPSQQYHPPPAQSYGAPKASQHSGGNFHLDHTIPMQVGNITPSSEPSANYLPITNIGVNIGDIHVAVHKNGKNLLVKRHVPDGGQIKTETKSLTLPYQVFPHTTGATYFPGRSNGELSIKLGQELPSGNTSEVEVARFTVFGAPGSQVERVQINVAQEPDHFVFSPGQPSAYDTQFVVVLAGSSFEFRSVYSFEDGPALKTVNGKQTVQLPIPPRLDQVDVSNDVVTVWPNRGESGAERVVADFDIYVELGR